MSQPGQPQAGLRRARSRIGLAYAPDRFPVVFWDLFGEQGHPVRATISEMGPLLLARLLELNDTQEGVLNVVFRVADEQGLLLLDLKDLRAVLHYVADNASRFRRNTAMSRPRRSAPSSASFWCWRARARDKFFGEPALDIADFMRIDRDGRGVINILAADKLMRSPRLYATFLLWLLSELFEKLPEVGDLDKPKLVFFFDEAHLLFDDAPKALLTAIEQVVRLIRSKGVGVYFVTQNPLDVPDSVLGQLGNRVQHALRAFTPRDQKAVRAAAETFRQNPAFDTAEAITAARRRRGARVHARRQERAANRRSRAHRAAVRARRADHRRRSARRRSRRVRCAANTTRRSIAKSAFEVLQKRAEGHLNSAGAGPARADEPTQASAGGGIIGTIGGVVGGLFKRGNPEAHVDGRARHALGGAIGGALHRHADREGSAARRARRDIALSARYAVAISSGDEAGTPKGRKCLALRVTM